MEMSRAIALLALALLASGCATHTSVDEDAIRSAISRANYCEATDDCAFVSGKCPLGCNIYVNKREFERIRKMIDAFGSDCLYDCIYCPPACAGGTCEAVCG